MVVVAVAQVVAVAETAVAAAAVAAAAVVLVAGMTRCCSPDHGVARRSQRRALWPQAR